MSVMSVYICIFFFLWRRRRHTRLQSDWSSDVCSSDLDVVGRKLGRDGITECENLGLVRDISHKGRHPDARRRPLEGERLRLGHGVGEHVARRDVASLGSEMADELPAHPRAATGDNGDAPLETLHGRTPFTKTAAPYARLRSA